MNHPSVDELTGFLYDDNGDGLDPARVEEIRAHVAHCEQCRARVSTWRGVRSDLATWTLANLTDAPPASAPRLGFLRPVLKWAVAAAVLMGGGFALARMSQKPPELSALRETLRGELAAEVRAELGGELAAAQAQFASEQAARTAAFERAVVRALGELEARQVVAHAALRKDVETLAVRAQQGFDQIAYSGRSGDAQDRSQQQ